MKVVVTRAAADAGRLAAALRAAGFDVEECPLIRIEPISGPAIDPAGYDWVVLTSRPAVDLLFDRLSGPLPRVAAVGPGTAEALRTHGVEPALVASESTQEGLVRDLRRYAGRVLFPAAEGARDHLAVELVAEVVPLYRTVETRPPTFPSCDLVVLASASAARSYATLEVGAPCVSIGPVTSAEARRLGLVVLTQASSHDLEGLVEAVRLAASRLVSSRS
jgi:uroporphyrinogen-III synthase